MERSKTNVYHISNHAIQFHIRANLGNQSGKGIKKLDLRIIQSIPKLQVKCVKQHPDFAFGGSRSTETQGPFF